jgi:phosphonoacetaldehyde hydrolase
MRRVFTTICAVRISGGMEPVMNYVPIDTKHKIQAVVFDWAGTAVDYGCFAPLDVFLEVFASRGIDLTLEEARGPMGMLKIDHIRALTRLPRVAAAWKSRFGNVPGEEDVNALYAVFEPLLLKILAAYTTPIKGVLETVAEIRARGLKIGSTTGYTDSMMEIVVAEAAKKGYAPDSVATPDGLPAGRPAPFMVWENLKHLGIYPASSVIKVGDTLSDIREGVNAGCYSVGIVVGSSEMGLKETEAEALPPSEFEAQCAAVEQRFLSAGANCTIRTMRELPGLIDLLNSNV